ncbi:MAG: enoyl-CoA hydratase-related protein [Thermohalobaculum sp.]|nr:enoyl-CoA hydratase-related protein [Thermohalobaculum sp.]
MTYQTLHYDLTDHVATVTLARPDKMNSLNRTLRLELMEALGRAGHEGRAVILTGSGRAFCAGQDLGDGGNAAQIDLERTLAEEYEPLLRLIADCPVPTIAAVNGVAAGAGANIALAADIVLAARGASFIEAFARIGLIPDAGGTFWLPRLVGQARAMAMCLLAEPIDAERAAEWGLIWEVVQDDLLDARARQIATRLAAGPTVAYRLTKQALRASAANTLEDQLALEARLQGEAGRSRDFAEGVMAFLEKRAPTFEGR